MPTTFPALEECEKEIEVKAAAMAKIFEEAGPKLDMDLVKCIDGDSAAKALEIKKRNDELTELGKKRDGLREVGKAADAVKQHREQGEGGDGSGRKATGDRAEKKSLGDMFVESEAFTGKKGAIGPEAHLDVEVKTLFETGAGWAPETTRTGRVMMSVQQPIKILDIIPVGSTGQAAIVYMEETTYTNAAAETAEGGTYPEAALALTEKSSPVRKIAVWLPVTDEQLEDVPFARQYVNNRLPFMIRQRLAGQVVVGNGTAPNLRGILNVSGIQTQAKGADPVPDAVYKAMVKVMVNGDAQPDAYVTNPLDWQDIRLLRTEDGIYIWGNPSEAGPERIWGLSVVQEQRLTQNTGIVGDFGNFSELTVRRGLDVQVSNSHADYFINGKQAIRCDIRAAFTLWRPPAFCTVTDI